MTPPARLLALLAGLGCMVLAGAELVRQAVLAAEPGVVWPASEWWAGLTDDPSWTTTGVAAAVVAAVAALLIVVAVRQLGDRRRGPALVEFGSGEERTRLSVPGLEQTLARRVEAVLSGARVARLSLDKDGPGWRVRVEASLPTGDLEDARKRAFSALAADLRRIGGLELVRLDIVVTSMRGKAKARP